MIEVDHLSKRFGDKLALSDLSFSVRPGLVTGFLGPNGAGKSTTMRVILGLDRPTLGQVRVDGRPFAHTAEPLAKIGAVLDVTGLSPGRSAYDHLRAVGATAGIGAARVNQALADVGLAEVAKRRVGGFSLGMRQRLGIACALIGDPEIVILDEPVNGLDPEGVRWIRSLLQDLAAQGRTVFVSSHLMSEMALTAQHLVVIARGQLVADASVDAFVRSAAATTVRVRTSVPPLLSDALAGDDVTISSSTADPGLLEVTGLAAAAIGDRALAAGLPIHELTPVAASLEDAFMELTRDKLEYTSAALAPQQNGPRP
ncbi:MAG: ABC transporter ATP-binding protein [Propionibacteriaceae bacterium]|jgi:ABC-2 type transport system ATP-binding protein|nr:ABC transporter ATP-binding protein [Propionibacteriaceae bacterium]